MLDSAFDDGADEARLLFDIDRIFSDWAEAGPDILEKSFAAVPDQTLGDAGLDTAAWLADALASGAGDPMDVQCAMAACRAANAATAGVDPSGCEFREAVLRWIGERIADMPAPKPRREGPRQNFADWLDDRPAEAAPPPAPRPPPAYGMNERGEATLRVNVRPPLAGLVLARDMHPILAAGGSLVRGLLDTQAMSVIYAPSNVGKSFLMLDIAFHIAAGRDWRGRKIKRPGAVLYIASEGGRGFINRVVAVKRHYNLPDDADVPLAVLPCPIDLLDPNADRDAIVNLIDDVSAEFNQPVVMLVLDTLSRIMTGGDENAAKDMTAVVSNIDNIRQRSNVHTAIVHHAGKDIAKGARGHSSLRAATDTEIELTRTGEGDDKRFLMAVRKQRELIGDDTFVCNLQTVFLGRDEDGEPVTSAVVEHIDDTDPNQKNPAAKHTANDIALRILTDLIASQGRPLPSLPDYPEGLSGVTEEAWRQECDMQRLSKSENESSRDRAFRRVFENLHLRNVIGTRNGHVWVVP